MSLRTTTGVIWQKLQNALLRRPRKRFSTPPDEPSIIEALEARILLDVTADWNGALGQLTVQNHQNDALVRLVIKSTGGATGVVRVENDGNVIQIDGGIPKPQQVQKLFVLIANDDIVGVNNVDVSAVTSNAFTANPSVYILGRRGSDFVRGSGDLADEVHGVEGDDTIWGGGGNDTLKGGPDLDVINGEGGNDEIWADGEGSNDSEDIGGGNFVVSNNTLHGGDGKDTITGGRGNDEIKGGDDNDSLIGREGNDTIKGDNGIDDIEGGDDADQLHGGANNDIIFGGAGNDTIKGNAGKDHIVGGANNDEIRGDVGNDSIFGDSGDDTIYGGDGNDLIFGLNDNDLIFGDGSAAETGRDTIHGGSGHDELHGGRDADILYGLTGNDKIYGGADVDLIYGGQGDDLIRGEDGEDELYSNTNLADKDQPYDGVFPGGANPAYVNDMKGTGDWFDGDCDHEDGHPDPQCFVVIIAATDANASEVGPDPGEFTVTRSGDMTTDLTVSYFVDVGTTATEGTDFDWLDGYVVIPDGASSATFTIDPFTDSEIEGDEYVQITLMDDPESYTLGTSISDTVTIADAPAPVVTIVATDASADEVGLDPGEFTVSRTGSTINDLTVYYFPDSGTTAMDGIDFAELEWSVTIPTGAGSATIGINPFADSEVEGNEYVVVTLIEDLSSSYVLGTPITATVTIADAGLPLTAAAAPVDSTIHIPLTNEQLSATFEAAIAFLAQAQADAQVGELLSEVSVQIADLPGLTLGLASTGLVRIDVDAAGYGWFIDTTPFDNSEFDQLESGEFETIDSGPAAGRMDLFTVVMHEVGHFLGLEDLDPSEHPHELMTATIGPGVRRLPASQEAFLPPEEVVVVQVAGIPADAVPVLFADQLVGIHQSDPFHDLRVLEARRRDSHPDSGSDDPRTTRIDATFAADVGATHLFDMLDDSLGDGLPPFDEALLLGDAARMTIDVDGKLAIATLT